MTITFEVEHGGIDESKNAALRERLRDAVRTAALSTAHLERWPRPECVKSAIVTVVARNTMRAGSDTIALIGAELGRWLYAGAHSGTFVPTRREKLGAGKRLIITVTAQDVREYVDGATAARDAAYATFGDVQVRPDGTIENQLRRGEIPAFLEMAPTDERGRPIARLPLGSRSLSADVYEHSPDTCRNRNCEPCNEIDEQMLRPNITIVPGSSRSSGRDTEKKPESPLERMQRRMAG